MHVIILKYVQVLCITIFFSNNVNCDKLLLHNEQEDQQLYRIGSCTAACMVTNGTGGDGSDTSTGNTSGTLDFKSLEKCYKLCSENVLEMNRRPLVQRTDPKLHIRLICRDSTNLIIQLQSKSSTTGSKSTGRNANQLTTAFENGDKEDSYDDDARRRPESKLSRVRLRRAIGGTGNSLTSVKDSRRELVADRKATTSERLDEREQVVQPEDNADGRHRQQRIYLVKVQESEKEMGERIVYMCVYSKVQHIRPEKGDNVFKIDATRDLSLKLFDRDVGKYAFENESFVCQLSDIPLGEFGVYDFRISDTGCALETAKEPVDIYLSFVTLALLILAAFGLIRITSHVLRRTRQQTHHHHAQPDGNDADKAETDVAPIPITATPARKRLQSLDTFRGIAIMLMIFVNSGGGHYWWIEHATWNGLHVADLVFPWFLFIMGVCIPIALRSQVARGAPRRTILSNIAIRSLKLFAIGVCLNSMSGPNLANLRLFGVLQRFAVAYFVVSTIHLYCYRENIEPQSLALRRIVDIVRIWKHWLLVGALTAIYLLVICFVPAPGCPSGYFGPGGKHLMATHVNCTGGVTGYIDRAVLGMSHIYQRPTARLVYDALPFDPEGPFGCLPTILQVALGLQCGVTILSFITHGQRIKRFAAWTISLGLLAGIVCGFSKNDGWIPVNKNLWSLSYVLATTSLAYLLLLLCYIAIDVKRLWSGNPFVYAGMNAIILYVGHSVFSKMLPWHWRIGFMNTHFVLTLEALWNATLWNVIAYILYRRKFFYSI